METATIRPARVYDLAIPAYVFEGDWDELDRAVVEMAMRQCVPPMVDPIFNDWRLLCLAGRFIARRAMWNSQSIYARDAGNLARELLRYHDKAA